MLKINQRLVRYFKKTINRSITVVPRKRTNNIQNYSYSSNFQERSGLGEEEIFSDREENYFESYQKQKKKFEDEWNEWEGFRFRNIWKPLILTSLFIPSCFLISSEAHKKFMERRKERATIKVIDRRERFKRRRNWFKYSKKDFDRNIHLLIGLNAMIFLMWQLIPMQPFCRRFFLHRYSDSKFFPLLGSSFSHQGVLHLYVNMLALHSFSQSLYYLMGTEQFWSFYLMCGVFSSLFSKFGHSIRFGLGSRTLSNQLSFFRSGGLGASGVVVGMVCLLAQIFPEQRVKLMFVPDRFNFSIKNAVQFGIAFDLIGALLGWRGIDHFAHLGGYLFGAAYWKFGMKKWMDLSNTKFTKFISDFLEKAKNQSSSLKDKQQVKVIKIYKKSDI